MKKAEILELAVLLALCVGAVTGVWADRSQGELASRLVRLHVLARDDSHAEQAVKLRVRDAVLEYVQPKLEQAADRGAAEDILQADLEGIRTAAARAAEGRPVTVTLGREQYPTRQYDTFALPAGEYVSLRVVLDEGRGQNWWCVVYPPLCMSAATETVQETLGTGERGYVVKFRIMELWGELVRNIERREGEDGR